jgi:hypothetical protein
VSDEVWAEMVEFATERMETRDYKTNRRSRTDCSRNPARQMRSRMVRAVEVVCRLLIDVFDAGHCTPGRRGDSPSRYATSGEGSAWKTRRMDGAKLRKGAGSAGQGLGNTED